MSLDLPLPLRRTIKATGFWQENQLILRELKYFPGIVILAIAFPLLAAAFEGIGVGFLLAFLQSLVNPNGVPFQTGVRWFDIWVLGIETSELSRLYRASALILLVTWIRAGFNYFTSIYLETAQIKLVDALRKRIFEQLQSFQLSFFSKSNSGEIINSLTTEISQLKQILELGSFLLVKGLVLVVYAVIALQISWKLSVISIFLFTLLFAGLFNLRSWVREASFAVSTANSKFAGVAIELVNGMRVIQASAAQGFERQRFDRASSDVVKTSVKTMAYAAFFRPLAEGLATAILIAIIIVGMMFFVSTGELQAASLLTFLFLLFRLVPAAQEINGNIGKISSLHGSLKNIEDLLSPQGKPYFQNGKRKFAGFDRAIEFVAVDFSYGSEALVLQDITLTIQRGQTIALVGASGAGKTTLVDLIPRFYDPTQGRILLDGADLKEFDINTVRQKMAIVSQDTFIFNASVYDNIAYGLEQVTQTELEAAAHNANALEFIHKLPEGFETRLGDRGVRLSGGQRQRLAIARALLRNPEILILDEATSALDSASERLIQEAVETLSIGRTVIAIAHRLSTIVQADKVVVLEQGRIVEQGTYQELLRQHGKLWQYHQLQNEVKTTE